MAVEYVEGVPPELRERAVRMVSENSLIAKSEWAVMGEVAGCWGSGLRRVSGHAGAVHVDIEAQALGISPASWAMNPSGASSASTATLRSPIWGRYPATSFSYQSTSSDVRNP